MFLLWRAHPYYYKPRWPMAMTVHVLSLLHGRQIFGSINSEDKWCRLPAVRFL
jgi:hypothetical protein